MSERFVRAVARVLPAGLLACVAHTAQAQVSDSGRIAVDTARTLTADPWTDWWEHAHLLSFDMNSLYDSNVLRNELVTAFWQGGSISREMRQRSAGTMSTLNRAGYILESSLSYSWGDSLFGRSSWRPRIAVAYHDVLGMRYPDDLYNVTFFGNAGYENDVADLAPADHERIRYQTVGFGMENRKNRTRIMLQLVSGQGLSASRVERADLYTATDGRYLQLDLDGDHRRSADDGETGWRSRGIGAAVSARVNIPVPGVQLYLGVDDLGAIAWNDEALHVTKDTVILYDGIQAEDVLDLDGVLLEPGSLQDTLGLGYEPGAFVRALPARAYAEIALIGAHHMRYEAVMDARYLPGYLPHGALSATHFFGRNAVQAGVSFGGFGTWRLGVGFERICGRHLRVELKAPNVIGWASENAMGRSLALGAAFAW